jgi:energy-coupling factor transporter ATP-binding protein EcfA2
VSSYQDYDTRPTVETIDRAVFMREYWEYEAGQHVTLIGPNGRGKTTLGLDLLGATASKEMQAFVLVSKPRDETIDRYTKKLKYRTIETYPPDPHIFKKPAGYMVRPHQSLTDLEGDETRLHNVFRSTMRGCYASPKPNIVFADEVQELQSGLKLKKECEAFWKRGRSLKSGLWACAQRSAHNSQDMYNAPAHLFLFSDPDKRNRQRFAEIGGVDPDLVMECVYNLDDYQALYIKRSGSHLCVINP